MKCSLCLFCLLIKWKKTRNHAEEQENKLIRFSKSRRKRITIHNRLLSLCSVNKKTKKKKNRSHAEEQENKLTRQSPTTKQANHIQYPRKWIINWNLTFITTRARKVPKFMWAWVRKLQWSRRYLRMHGGHKSNIHYPSERLMPLG